MNTKIFLTDLTECVNGALKGEWIDLSKVSDTEEALELANIPSNHEFFITDYESCFKINEYDNIDNLIEKASLVEEFDDELDMLEYILDNYSDREYHNLLVFDDLDEMLQCCCDNDPLEAARMVYFGNIQFWNDDYFRFDGYGNIESLNQYQYEKELLDLKNELLQEYFESEL